MSNKMHIKAENRELSPVKAVRKITIKRFREILKTVNPNTVKSVNVELLGNNSGDMPSYANVQIGTIVYQITLIDIDIRYWRDEIITFLYVIRSSGVPYTSNEYVQRIFSGEIVWKV